MNALLPKLSLHCIAIALSLSASVAVGDLFLLNNGGQIQGRWLNREDSLSTPYRVQTTAGLTLNVERKTVKQVITQRDDEVAYEALAPKVADTVDEQWKLAQWCRDRYLKEQREVHLQRILELDPDHLPTRRALGYAQISGEWLTRDEWQKRKGYVYFRGRMRLPQEVELLTKLSDRKTARREWLAQIGNWREMLMTDDAKKARDALLAIDDPQAVTTLAQFLQTDTLRVPKLIYITALTNIGNGAAVEALAVASLNDADEEVRVACLDAIEQLDPPGVVGFYVKALGHTNNFVVNRAAYALARVGDASVAAPLVDALVTTHTMTYQPNPQASADTITTSFVSGARADAANAPPLVPNMGSGLSVGDGKKSITRRIPNQEVLTALLRLSGGPNYGYNQQVWRQWLESQHQGATLDGRRQ